MWLKYRQIPELHGARIRAYYEYLESINKGVDDMVREPVASPGMPVMSGMLCRWCRWCRWCLVWGAGPSASRDWTAGKGWCLHPTEAQSFV